MELKHKDILASLAQGKYRMRSPTLLEEVAKEIS